MTFYSVTPIITHHILELDLDVLIIWIIKCHLFDKEFYIIYTFLLKLT